MHYLALVPTGTCASARLAALVLGGFMLVAAAARADRVRLLEDPREAMLARAELIAGAQHEIVAESFIVGDDRLTFGVLSLLRDAARRGVDVKLLADASWNHVPGAMQAHLREEGVQIRDYHPLRIDRLHWITRRLHDKLLVVDGRVLLLGGRNIEAPYFGDGANVDRRDYIDCDIVAESDEAEHARRYFLSMWGSSQVEATMYARFPEDRARAGRRVDQSGAWLRDQLVTWELDPVLAGRDWHEVECLRFVHDPVARKGEDPGVAEVLMELVASARREVLIESPYLIPSRSLKSSLSEALSAGARVRILTNSLATTDNLWPQAAYAGDKRPLVRRGVELWEYEGPESLHSKTMVVDELTSVVGSFNLDPRSEELNTEMALIVEDGALAAELETVMDFHLRSAWNIGADGRPVGETSRHPGVTPVKVWRMRLRRLAVPFLRGQL